jgi:predicted HD superfamily hydrolase involved in NAD metabolism
MDRFTIQEIRDKLNKNLNAGRFEHSEGVCYTASCLAMRYGVDPRKAVLAGLLHDCAKQYKDKDLVKVCDESNVPISDEERLAPQVLHAVYGPFLAKKKYGIEDREILEAIRWHTTGKDCMNELEKIIFVADYIEPNRCKSDILPEVRALAFRDLTFTVYRITEETLKYLKENGYHIDSTTQKCYDWLKENGIHDIQ